MTTFQEFVLYTLIDILKISHSILNGISMLLGENKQKLSILWRFCILKYPASVMRHTIEMTSLPSTFNSKKSTKIKFWPDKIPCQEYLHTLDRLFKLKQGKTK